MIVNKEQDNTIEGEYLKVISGGDSEKIIIDLPSSFYVNQNNCRNWVVGWGNNKALFDAGVENLRTIDSINPSSKRIILGKILRGEGFPQNDQRIVFWNINPSGFIKEQKQAIIHPKDWTEFQGESVGFSSIVFDSLTGMWTMLINEVDTDMVQVYAAVSGDLIRWSPANNGKPLFTVEDFKNISWAGKSHDGSYRQTAIISDVIRFHNKWYLFMDGYDITGKRHIGLAIAEQSVCGPYKILPDPLISPGTEETWNDKSCFYAKVTKYKNNFILFYDGRNKMGEEQLGMATSNDLMRWEEYNGNPVLSQHTGWRSSLTSTEPNYIEVRGDSIFLVVSGAKKFKMGLWHHYITGKMYMDKSGNVNDTELGVFLSTDGGKTFVPHENNPVFINDYSNINENDHLGGNFELIKTDSADFIFYQSKTDTPKLKYGIFCRIKRK